MNVKPTTWRPWKNCWMENEPPLAWKNGICEMGALRNQVQANSAPLVVAPPPPHLQQHHLPPSSPSPSLALGNAQFRDFESLWMPSSHLLVSIFAETYTTLNSLIKLSCYGGFGVAKFSSSRIKPPTLQTKPRFYKTRVSEPPPSPQQVRASLGFRWRRRCIRLLT